MCVLIAGRRVQNSRSASYSVNQRAVAKARKLIQARQYVESNRGVDADVVACVVEGEIACVNLVMIRAGRHVGDRSFFPANAEGAEPREVVAAFLEQHYLEQPCEGVMAFSSSTGSLVTMSPGMGCSR